MFEQGITSKLKLKVTELIFPEISLGVQPVLGILKVCEEPKVMLHGTIRNDDFERNISLQCWNTVLTIRNNVATMLQRCVALKIVVANRLV